MALPRLYLTLALLCLGLLTDYVTMVLRLVKQT